MRTRRVPVAETNQYQVALGRWLLIDVRMRMLMSGNRLYDGISLNKTLGLIDRRILKPRIEASARDRTSVTEVVRDNHSGVDYDVAVIPLLDPVDGKVTALQACYTRAGETRPERPLAGAWQWQSRYHDGVPETTAIWSDEVFALFDLEVPPRAEARYPDGNRLASGFFTQRLVDAPFSHLLQAVIEEATEATDDRLIHRTYRTRTARGTERDLRMLCRRIVDDPFARSGPDRLAARGCTIELAAVPATPSPAPEPIAATLLMLSRDPFFLANPEYGEIWQTNERFDELGLTVPTTYRLREMCHPEDADAAMGLLEAAIGSPSRQPCAAVIRFALGDGGYRHLRMTATMVPVHTPTVVACRLDAVD